MIFDVAVIGAGPTGILAAHKFLESGLTVALIESGNWVNESMLSKKNYDFYTPSKMPDGVHKLGGASNLWHGRVSRFPKNCLERTDFYGKNIWPINFEIIKKRYQELASIVGFKIIEEDNVALDNLHSCQNCAKTVGKSLYQFIKPQFFKELLQSFSKNPKLSLFLNTYVTTFESDPENTIISNCKVKDSLDLKISSTNLVIAAGCLQSTALVQRSFKDTPFKNPIGKFLMEHFDGFIGTLKIKPNQQNCLKNFKLDDSRRLPGTNFGLGITTTSNTKLNWHLELCSFQKTYTFDPYVNRFNLPLPALKILFLIERCIVFIPFLLLYNYYRFRKISVYSLWLKGEEQSVHTSRIEISAESKIKYKHHISSETVKILKSELRLFSKSLNKNKLGKLKFNLHFRIPNFLSTGGNFHPMGTLRMHSTESSIVKFDGSLGNFSNIFCVDSSVFPIGAHQNPTAMALTLTLETISKITNKYK